MAGELLEHGFPTPSGKFEFWSEAVAEFSPVPRTRSLPTYRDPFDDHIGDPAEYPLKLITGARIPQRHPLTASRGTLAAQPAP